ncbi:hypothetical protein [Pedomonas mirosovicensis]|uniref:hypothetical protein n=1 Tax=Pedomonas mirosovicensis TaxID=2908641 RepID=UPI0021679721|nr:hypothetical protein [Pedomonas mirosovicensis]MCH8684224.1 hypothetical protein [Pedomonas mirosovicensis]
MAEKSRGAAGDEKAESYMIAPRDPRNETQLQELQRCREELEALPASQVSESRTLLKAKLPPSLARQIGQRFAEHLIIEKDTPLPDPRMMPDLKF